MDCFSRLSRIYRQSSRAISSAVVLATAACGGASGGPPSAGDQDASGLAVHGGRETNPESIRQVVRVSVDGAVVCSGVLVRSHVVLTAAHCLEHASADRVEAQVPRRGNQFDSYSVKKLFKQDFQLHNNILAQSGSNALKVDVAALVLESSVVQDPNDPDSPYLPPLAILSPDVAASFIEANKMSRLAFLEREADSGEASPFRLYGYGYTSDMDTSGANFAVGTLRDAVVPLRGRWGLFDEELHVGFKRTKACWADSGGPLIATKDGARYVVGVAARFFTYDEGVTSCSASDGSIYTDVTSRHVKVWLDGIFQQNPVEI